MKSIFVVAALAAAFALPQAVAQRRGQGSSGACSNVCTQSGPHGQPQGGGRQHARQGNCDGQGQGARRGQGGGVCNSPGAGASTQALVPAGTTLVIPPGILRNYLKTLQSTLERELYARDYYTAAAQALNGPPRFGNLALAEQKHANAVANMITFLGGTPVLAHNIPVVVPATVAEADAVCEQVELFVIDVYKRLINACPDPALLPVLNNIQASNYAHLDAVNG